MPQVACTRTRYNDKRWGRRTSRLPFGRRILRNVFHRVFACSVTPNGQDPVARRYRRLAPCFSPSLSASATRQERCLLPRTDIEVDTDLVALKITLFGDCHVGKTSFMYKYVGDVEEKKRLQTTGLNLMDRIQLVRGARIGFNIWDVAGDDQYLGQIPLACEDSVAILIMFDLTSRCTLNNAIGWYIRARKCNKTAIPILIGTKFDNFIQLPLDMQWTIVNEHIATMEAKESI